MFAVSAPCRRICLKVAGEGLFCGLIIAPISDSQALKRS